MKNTAKPFIPKYEAWKQECKRGVRATPVSEIRHSTNAIFAALLQLKQRNERLL